MIKAKIYIHIINIDMKHMKRFNQNGRKSYIVTYSKC